MNIVVTDKTENSRQLLTSYLQKIENVELLGTFDDLNLEFIDLRQIDLIIFDINSENCDKIIAKIKNLKNKKPELNFIATSFEINSELVSKTLKDGFIQDFILKPLIPSVLEASIKKISENGNKKIIKKAKTFCVFSNKAGVGKTSIAVNLAFEIAKITQEKVCLLDFSFNNSDVATFLNVNQNFNIDFLISKLEKSNKETFLSMANRYKNSSLYTLCLKEELDINFKPNSQTITKIINQLKNIFDWIIIDTKSPLEEESLAIFNSCDIILLISLLNLVSIRNCQKCLEMFNKIGYSNDKVKLVINRYIENSEITINDIKRACDKDIFYKIPNNYLTLEDAINLGETVGEINPQSNIAKAYKNISNEIINIDFLNLNECGKINYNHGVFNLLRRMGE